MSVAHEPMCARCGLPRRICRRYFACFFGVIVLAAGVASAVVVEVLS